MKKLLGVFLICVVVSLFGCEPKTESTAGKQAVDKQAQISTIKDGSVVKFDYTLMVEGEVVDSSQGGEPLEYTHGQMQIIPGLEKALAGLKAGDAKSVDVSPEEGYGEISQEAFKTVPKNLLPENMNVEPDMTLAIEGPQGQLVPVKVSEVNEDSIVLDLNHPLAGKKLSFKVNIVSVQ